MSHGETPKADHLDQLLGSWHSATRSAGMKLGYPTANPLSVWSRSDHDESDEEEGDSLDDEIRAGEHAAIERALAALTPDERAAVMVHARNCGVQANVYVSPRAGALTPEERAALAERALEKMRRSLQRDGVL